jgi:hypothetical protein
MKRCRSSQRPLLSFLALATALPVCTPAVAADKECHVRIEVSFEASVRNPRDPSFLSALTSSPLYALTWVQSLDDGAVYELTGPATDYQCEQAVGRLSRNAAITDLRVLPEDEANYQK